MPEEEEEDDSMGICQSSERRGTDEECGNCLRYNSGHIEEEEEEDSIGRRSSYGQISKQ